VSAIDADTAALPIAGGPRPTERSWPAANQPFGEWGKVFPDQAMTLAAIDRLVHHATILEMNVESFRRRTALDRKRGPGRPPTRATIEHLIAAPRQSQRSTKEKNACAYAKLRQS
jgi:IstB-like ATP binding protein